MPLRYEGEIAALFQVRQPIRQPHAIGVGQEVDRDQLQPGATIKASYQLIYQKDLSDEQVRFILELDQNKDSAGYADIVG